MSPRICRSIEPCDYAARAPALRLLAVGPDEYEQSLDDVLAHPRLREIVDCLARMATAGFLESTATTAGPSTPPSRVRLLVAEDLEAPEWSFGTSTWDDDVGDPFAG